MALRLNQEATKLLAVLLAIMVCMMVAMHSLSLATAQPITMDTYSNGVSNVVQGGLWVLVGVASAVGVVLTAPVSVPVAVVLGIVAVGSTVAGTLQAAGGIQDMYSGAIQRSCARGCMLQ